MKKKTNNITLKNEHRWSIFFFKKKNIYEYIPVYIPYIYIYCMCVHVQSKKQALIPKLPISLPETRPRSTRKPTIENVTRVRQYRVKVFFFEKKNLKISYRLWKKKDLESSNHDYKHNKQLLVPVKIKRSCTVMNTAATCISFFVCLFFPLRRRNQKIKKTKKLFLRQLDRAGYRHIRRK